MTTQVNKNDTVFKVEIGLNEGQQWSDEKFARIKTRIKEKTAEFSPEQKIKIQLLSIQYTMEEYLNEDLSSVKKVHSLETFLKTYLKTLKMPLKTFAIAIDTTDGNLKKYLSGERKFNTDLALKFGHFFHTSPDLWLRVHLKNELIELNKEKKQIRRYKKYDYQKVLSHAV
ncbi:helix-turn-helix transcriptional regulator [Dinghuibacter silviterrae]|uniref:Plasmid maintenance system antidote protein VapI n=1 Tax=Dinghuibacter silviterrae TaxID=1539049 RepID=A0A4R8DQU2_9BACT|nr:transcriptional regulator [Dinghuibacter silviterrae]TDX00530.1 plasmid maintenance system antidote protein VapI [Dinghuibacter silviterrae]